MSLVKSESLYKNLDKFVKVFEEYQVKQSERSLSFNDRKELHDEYKETLKETRKSFDEVSIIGSCLTTTCRRYCSCRRCRETKQLQTRCKENKWILRRSEKILRDLLVSLRVDRDEDDEFFIGRRKRVSDRVSMEIKNLEELQDLCTKAKSWQFRTFGSSAKKTAYVNYAKSSLQKSRESLQWVIESIEHGERSPRDEMCEAPEIVQESCFCSACLEKHCRLEERKKLKSLFETQINVLEKIISLTS